ncbi:hypothetical protein GCM10022289_45090 [Pedobacter jeongneungensis]|uniref:Nucleoside phosphorylase domain-containing protein n=1 Tax=Pedobacter jeongneungensis TaxID=947309 RepID=A0ABP8BQ19_9SPHI
MEHQYDLSKPLHIFFNETPINEKDNSDSQTKNFSQLIANIPKIQYLEIEYKIEKFLLLLSLMPDELEIYVWIHPNIKRTMGSDTEYPPLIVADSLRVNHPEIRFRLISRHPLSAPAEIKSKYTIDQITTIIGLDIQPQKLSEIRKTRVISKNTSSKKTVDFAIVTALFKDEFESLVEVFNLEKDAKVNLGGKSVYTGKLKSYPEKNIVAVYQTDVGITEASALVTEVIREFKPRYVFMTGVCGGAVGTKLGTVVIAKYIFRFHKGKLEDDRFLRELEFVKIDELLIRSVKEGDSKNINLVKAQLIGSPTLNERFHKFNFQSLKSIIDPMACTEYVVDKKDYFKEVIQSIDRKATAVEMESYGVARATETSGRGETKALIIKSVMDNTTAKNDKAKGYASYTSAMYLNALLESGTIV